MAHDPYAPKHNPDAEVIEPPAFLLRQDRPGARAARPVIVRPNDSGTALEVTPAVWPHDQGLYVDEAPAPETVALPPKRKHRDPTDIESIAAWIERLTWTDMKALATAILAERADGKTEPLTATELGDMFESFAAKTMKQHPDREQAA